MSDAPSTDLALGVHGVSKWFGTTCALDRVDLTVASGSVHGLLGANGAGKSTLIRILSGVHPADDGQVTVFGRQMTCRSVTESQRAGVSTIFQNLDLVPTLSVRENIGLGGLPRRKRSPFVDWKALDRMVHRVAAHFSKSTFPDTQTLVGDLSVRDRYLVAIGRALAADARVLIMDEPTAGLGAQDVEHLLSVVDDLRRKGLAIIFVSHRLEEVLRICDHVTVLRDGRVAASRPTSEVSKEDLAELISPVPRSAGTVAAASARIGPPLLSVRLDRAEDLHGISFDLWPGEIVGLVGMVGSGRTRLLRAIYGSLPFEGRVHIAGKEMHFSSARAAVDAGVVLLPENRREFGLLPDASVEANLSLQAISRPEYSRFGVISLRGERRLAARLREEHGVKTASLQAPMQSLSGGNQQKVLFARASSMRPKIWLLDQPTAGLDVGAQKTMAEYLASLAADGSAVLVADEDPEFLHQSCGRFLFLKGGTLIDGGASSAMSASELMAHVH